MCLGDMLPFQRYPVKCKLPRAHIVSYIFTTPSPPSCTLNTHRWFPGGSLGNPGESLPAHIPPPKKKKLKLPPVNPQESHRSKSRGGVQHTFMAPPQNVTYIFLRPPSKTWGKGVAMKQHQKCGKWGCRCSELPRVLNASSLKGKSFSFLRSWEILPVHHHPLEQTERLISVKKCY